MRSVVCLFILLLDQRCTAGSAGVSMRPDGHAGLGPEGHCDMCAHLGSNVCTGDVMTCLPLCSNPNPRDY